jgi:epsin
MMQQQQQEEFMRQQMMQQEQQRQQEEWMRQQQQQQWQQQQAMQAQPTGYGSNNPFAPVGSQSLLGNSQPQASPQPSSSFLPVPVVSMENQKQVRPPSPAAPQPAKPAFNPPRKADTQHGELAGFLARGREDGMDTFGNLGNLRMSSVFSP